MNVLLSAVKDSTISRNLRHSCTLWSPKTRLMRLNSPTNSRLSRKLWKNRRQTGFQSARSSSCKWTNKALICRPRWSVRDTSRCSNRSSLSSRRRHRDKCRQVRNSKDNGKNQHPRTSTASAISRWAATQVSTVLPKTQTRSNLSRRARGEEIMRTCHSKLIRI